MLSFYEKLTMDSDNQQTAQRKKINLREVIPELAVKTGLSQQSVARVCDLLMKQIQSSIENDEVFKTKSLTVRSTLQKAKPANEKRGPVPERRIGRLVVNPVQDSDN